MYHDVSLLCKEPQYHLGHRFSEPTMQDLGGRQVCQVLKSTVEAQPRFIHPWSLSSRPNCSPMQFYSLACNKLQRYNWRNPDSDSDPIHFDGSPNFKMPFFLTDNDNNYIYTYVYIHIYIYIISIHIQG